jgi:hypothetical protein
LIAVGIFSQALLELQFSITAAFLFRSGNRPAVQRNEARSPAAVQGALIPSFLMRPSPQPWVCGNWVGTDRMMAANLPDNREWIAAPA